MILPSLMATLTHLLTATVVPDVQYASTDITAAELAVVASAMDAASPEIARVWPGYWSADEAFMVMSHEGASLLVSDWTPGDGFTSEDLPSGAKAWRKASEPGMNFPILEEVAGRKVYALPAMGGSLFHRTSFFVHEAFHGWQRGWAQNADSAVALSRTPSRVEFVKDPSVLARPEYLAAVAEETRLLKAAIAATDPGATRSALRAYFAARRSRLSAYPDIEMVERVAERQEGTATYVGCRSAGLAVTGPENAVAKCMYSWLDRTPNEANLLRWRQYGTGAALSVLLERLEVQDWRARVAAGERLDEILSAAV